MTYSVEASTTPVDETEARYREAAILEALHIGNMEQVKFTDEVFGLEFEGSDVTYPAPDVLATADSFLATRNGGVDG